LVSLGIPKLSNLPDTCALMPVSPRTEKLMAKSRRTSQSGATGRAPYAADKPGRQPGIYHRTRRYMKSPLGSGLCSSGGWT
jgi:hypothetical protein